ncbi:MAG: hypothetical protein H0Z38_06555 [Firmicutes bacterium]|nr:hypothetical protein [Bacillota bacterium]
MLQKIVCSGTPRALGQEYGLQCEELIRGFLEETEEYLASHLNLEPKLLAQRAAEYFEPSTQKHAPHLWEEIQGLAEACGQPLEKIWFLQGISEFTFGVYPENLAAAACAGATETGESIAAFNWDFFAPYAEKYLIVRETQTPEGNKVLSLTLAGSLGYAGISSHGTAFFSTSLKSSGIQKGLPVSIIARLALEQPDLESMVKIISELPRITARNFLLADGTSCVNLETTISEQVPLWPSAVGLLVHANHFVSDRFKEVDLGSAKWPESSERFQRCSTLLSQSLPISNRSMAQILADHVNSPKGICRHGIDGEKAPQTIASAIAQPASSSLLVCPGNPCSNKWTSFSLTGE